MAYSPLLWSGLPSCAGTTRGGREGGWGGRGQGSKGASRERVRSAESYHARHVSPTRHVKRKGKKCRSKNSNTMSMCLYVSELEAC